MTFKGKTDFTPADRRLVAAALAPGFVWFTHLSIAYSLVPSACLDGSEALVHAATLLAAPLTVAIGLWSWRALGRVNRGWPSEDDAVRGRSRLLAIAGVVGGGMFTLLILANEIPIVVLRPCD